MDDPQAVRCAAASRACVVRLCADHRVQPALRRAAQGRVLVQSTVSIYTAIPGKCSARCLLLPVYASFLLYRSYLLLAAAIVAKLKGTHCGFQDGPYVTSRCGMAELMIWD